MADLLRTGAAFLANALKQSAGTSVTIARGNSSASVSAVIGKSVFESQNQSGVVESWESRDFIVKTADLPFGEPHRHDKIIEVMNGVAVVYEVASPRGVPVFHYGDAFRATVRMHAVASDEFPAVALGEQFKGAYDNGADYWPGDVVLYGSKFWVRVGEPNPGYAPGTAYWNQLQGQS